MPADRAGGRLGEIERNVMSLLAIFIICAIMLVIGISSNIVTR